MAKKQSAPRSDPGTSLHDDSASRLVYSTTHGRLCPGCAQPVAACTCGRPTAPAGGGGDGVLRVSREKAGRGGKTVTLVRGAPLDPDALQTLGKRLKTACGSGGTAKEGVVEIQGDHVERLVALLKQDGFAVKRAGG